MYNLTICEKPSQAQTYAAVLGANERKGSFFIGNSHIVAWCFGHLLELANPDDYDEKYKKWRYADLPITPDKWQYVAAKDKSEQLKILKDLLNRADVDTVINGCDAGREGELIFRLVYEHAKCKKPFKRLWISSMEDSAIRDGFANLKDGAEYDNLYRAALCRSQADWTVGINGTRLFSVLYNTPLNTGRVQSPTLAMLVKRESEIANFVKEPFYTAELDTGNFTASSERFNDKATAENAIAACNTATVTSVTKTEKSVAPPKLYDLTTLQREANRAYGYTAQQTLDYTQSLYEKKLATYPRVDSRYLTDDMTATVENLVSAIAPEAPCNAGQVTDSKKVSDHHANIPTIEAVTADLSALPSGERNILQLLKTRLVCAVGEKHRYLETVIALESGGTIFRTKGKIVLHNGWKDYDNSDIDADNDKVEQSANLPEIAEGQTFPAAAKLKEGFTSPPKHYTEDTILSAMTGARLAENAGAEDMPDEAERKGLGTPATRAAIIEKLVKTGFAERSKKNLLPTEKGINLITVLPTALTSAKLTADWENNLLEVQRGELAADEFMGNIAAFTKAIVIENNKPKPEFVALFPNTRKSAPPPGKCLGGSFCPRCGNDVTEGAKGFFCDNSDCGFKLWKESKFWTAKKKPLTAEIVSVLLKDGCVALKDLYSEKTGKLYSAVVELDDDGGKFINYKLIFNNKGGKK